MKRRKIDMARYYKWKCNNCDFKFTAFGPQECFVIQEDEQIIIKPLPHPLTTIAGGLFLHGYCKSCKMEKDMVIVAFTKPCDPWKVAKKDIMDEYLKNYSSIIKDHPDWEEIPTEGYNFSAVKCPDCSDELVVYPFRNKPFSCPTCENGTVEQVEEYWT
jgi:hypothetical protein